ncbi:MAG: ABC transporter [Chlamydiae bacterium RIFCSPHIGHO2_12_FULL_49_11]|nr:MAG: ABC transporter [Chlamydiae bacterium RIFCSPHIGHO2_12_FULL_49_11]
MKQVVSVRGLKKRFSIRGGFHEAVCGIDLHVEEGEIFGFLGPNGAGKTTTLRMFTTLLPIDAGEAFIAGYNVQTESAAVRTQIGFVSQSGGSDRSATGRENLILQARLTGLGRLEAKSRSAELIETLALEDCIDRFVSTYSGGQKRRLDIALGLLHRPKVLFLDEPSAGLDPQNRSNLWQLIKELKRFGVAVFLTSHYLDEVDYLSDRLAIMDLGKIIAAGTPKELKKEIAGDVITMGIHPETVARTLALLKLRPFVREIAEAAKEVQLFVDNGEEALPQLLRLLDTEQITLKTITLTTPTLNDVFLKKTGKSLREGEFIS